MSEIIHTLEYIKSNTSGRILSVDFGDTRTGLALSDMTRYLASGIGYVSPGGIVKTADKVAEDSPVAEEPTIMEEEVVAVAEAEEEAEVPAEVDDTEQFMVAEEPAAEKPEKAEKAEKAEKPAKAAKLGTLIGGNLFSPEDIRLAVAKQSAKESKKEAKNKVIEQTLF